MATPAAAPIFAIALMLYQGPPPAGHNPLAAVTTVYETPPVTTTSFGCQDWANEFNRNRGYRFTGSQYPFKGVKGIIVGAWCNVPVKVKPAKEKK